MKHPSELRLALFSGGDLTGLNAILTALHVRRCSKCAAEVAAMRSEATQLRDELNALPSHVAWDPLAAEMTGNIRVGVAAAACIAPISRNPRLGWRAGMVMASATVLLMAAWWLNVPHPRRVVSNAVVLQSTPTGIELQQNGATLELLHKAGSHSTIFVSAPRSLRSRSVDADTGQVTIYNVYAD